MGRLINSNNVDKVLSSSSRVKPIDNTTETSNTPSNINAEGGGEYTASSSKGKKALKITHVGSARGTNPL